MHKGEGGDLKQHGSRDPDNVAAPNDNSDLSRNLDPAALQQLYAALL